MADQLNRARTDLSHARDLNPLIDMILGHDGHALPELHVAGDAEIGGTLDVTGTITGPMAPVGGLTVTGNVIVNGTTTLNGDLTMGGAIRRILADFSNGTLNTRTMFKTSTANGITSVGAIPDGSGTTAGFFFSNSADTANASLGFLDMSATQLRLASIKAGTGTVLPISFVVNASTPLKLDDAKIGFFGTAPTTQQAVAVAAVDPATVITLANSLRAALIAYGAVV